MSGLDRCLLEQPVSLLRAIASYRSIDTGSNPSRATVLTALQKGLSTQQLFRDIIRKMTSWEYEIIYQLRDADGSIPVDDLQQSWGQDDFDLGKRWFWHETVNQGLARLRLSGIIFMVVDRETDKDLYVLPEEYLNWIPVNPLVVDDGSYAPYSYWSANNTFLSDIYLFLQYFQQFRVRPLQAGKLPKRHKTQLIKKLAEINPVELPRDHSTIDLLFDISQRMGFTGLRKGVLSPTSRAENWFRKAQVDQLRDVTDIWLQSRDQLDLETICGTRVESAGLRHSSIRVKTAVLELVGRLPMQWITIHNVSKYFQHHRPFFYRSDHSPGLWRLHSRKTGDLIAAHAIWNCLESRVIKHLLTDVLGRLGLVNLGLDPMGEIEAVHVTPLGRSIITGEEYPTDTPDDSPLNQIILQPDFEILAPSSMVLSVRDRLEKMTEFQSGGHVQRYKISRSSIAHAMETGMQGGEIIQFLEEVSREEIPGNVKMSLIDWIGEYGKIEIQPAILVKTEDEYLLQEILSRPATNKLISERLGPATAVVNPVDVQDMLSELKRVGYLPRYKEAVDEDFDDMASISLKIEKDRLPVLAELLNRIVNSKQEELNSEEDKLITGLLNQCRRLEDV